MIDLLLTEGTVVTMDQKRRIIEDGAVAVDQGKILFVGSSKEAEVKFPEVRKTINCRNTQLCRALWMSMDMGAMPS